MIQGATRLSMVSDARWSKLDTRSWGIVPGVHISTQVSDCDACTLSLRSEAVELFDTTKLIFRPPKGLNQHPPLQNVDDLIRHARGKLLPFRMRITTKFDLVGQPIRRSNEYGSRLWVATPGKFR